MVRGLVLLAGSVAARERMLDSDRILCPVLASMFNEGDLVPDAEGLVELDEMKRGLMEGIGVNLDLANFQAYGISDYDSESKHSHQHRKRCSPAPLDDPSLQMQGLDCFQKRFVEGEMRSRVVDESTGRWLNIFEMNGLQTVQHGFGTGVRGGNVNAGFDHGCRGIFPCEGMFQEFFLNFADENGRFYMAQMQAIMCHARSRGHRSGEFSYHNGVGGPPGFHWWGPGQEWQIKAAFAGWLAAFGERDESGELYMSTEAVRAMVMEGRYPDGWYRRQWGCMEEGCEKPGVLKDAFEMELPCEQQPWWQQSACESHTGQQCSDSCDGGALCISGQCVCGRDDRGLATCAKDGQCLPRDESCEYFGEPCRVVLADGPVAGWQPSPPAVEV